MSDDNDQKSTSSDFRIFISYSHSDAEAAEAADSLANLCSRTGAETWLDRYKLRTSENWSEQIEKAISRSNIFLVLLSSAGQADSSRQSREWSAICERKWIRPDIRVIPILLNESVVPTFLSGLQALDGSSKMKLARCVEHIADYPAVRAVPEQNTLSDEQRAEVERRFQELLDAVSEAPAKPDDAPQKGTQS